MRRNRNRLPKTINYFCERVVNQMDITGRLTFFASLFRIDENTEVGMWMLYMTIVVLAITVYKLGFAKKLPLGKSVIIYLVLILGCTLLTFLGVFLPIAEGLFVAVLVLAIYKIRLHNERRSEPNKEA